MHSLVDYWPDAALSLISLLSAWAAWSMRQMTKNLIDAKATELGARDDEISNRVDGHETRLTRVEARMDEVVRDIAELPTKADLARIEGEVKGVGREVQAALTGIRRIEALFLERGVERS